jgi:membrane fusion protein (multidrug efflux system)
MLKMLKNWNIDQYKHYRRPTIIMLSCLGLLLLILISIQVFKGHMSKKYMMMSMAPITVSAIKAEKQTWQPILHASASLRAMQGVDVTTEIAGLVRNIPFTPGSEVKKGDLLVELNSDSEHAQLAALEASAALAKITFDRDNALYLKQTVSKSTIDTDAADLKGKQALVEQQKAVIAKKNITAPFDGILGISTINPGQYINPADKIVTLQALNPIFADFYIPQPLLSKIQIGQSVILKTEPYLDKRLTGTISTIDPKIDPATRNVQVEATVENPNHLLLPGMFSKVEIDVGKPEPRLTLPISAISYNPYGDIVFIVEDSKENDPKTGKPIQTVKQVFVTLGETRGSQVSIEKGILEGDLIVTSGQLKLKNGSRVNINNTVVPNFDAKTPVPNERI